MEGKSMAEEVKFLANDIHRMLIENLLYPDFGEPEKFTGLPLKTKETECQQ